MRRLLWGLYRYRLRQVAKEFNARIDFIGRYMPGFFDYAIADEMHELANDTAQGQALGTLASCADRTLVLTGTYSGGYADEAFNNLFRLNPAKMLAEGYEYGEAGVRAFMACRANWRALSAPVISA